jgi:hypothetical protein
VKLKYYLRGLGIGIIVTTIILTISNAVRDDSISDEEVIARAAQLGMVMQEEEGGLFATSASGTEPEDENAQDELTPENAGDTNGNTEESTEDTGDTNENTEEPTEDTGDTAANDDGTPEDAGNTNENTGDAAVSSDNENTEMYTLVVVKGQVCRDVCEALAEAGIVEDSEALRKYLSQEKVADAISVGTYLVPMDATMQDIADILAAGSIEKQAQQNRN